MASSSTIPYVADMGELRANGLGVPLLFPVDALKGFATILFLRLSIRFELQDTSVWIEYEVCNPLTLHVTHTMILEVLSITDDGFAQWRLTPGKYRVYGLIISQMVVPMQFQTPHRSSSCTMPTPFQVRAKVEPAEHSIIELSESSEDDALPQPSQPKKPSSFTQYTSPGVSFPCQPRVSQSLSASIAIQSSCIVQSLHKVASMPVRKNILKRLDYDSIKTVNVDFLPP